MKSRIKNKLIDLADKHGGRMEFSRPLNYYSTISIGGPASVWYEISSAEEARQISRLSRDEGVRTLVIGRGSNLLLPDAGVNGIAVKLGGDFFSDIEFEGNTVTAGSGANLSRLISFCCRRGLSGLEGLVGIPASIGGALRMNASYKSAISDRLVRVRVLDEEGKDRWIDKREILFGYRKSSLDGKLIMQAVFHLATADFPDLKRRLRDNFTDKILKQPLEKKTLGCVFKNPDKSEYTSGKLIDMAGLKGLRRGSAEVSEKHANFIVNTGGAGSGDVIGLINTVRETVKNRFSVDLETEIEIVDA
ncbi:MAG: UDP-N-acetylmuramate dehydrogenase [Candidatus Omnitrophota bacterium]